LLTLILRGCGALLLLLCGWACGAFAVQRATARRAALGETLQLLARLEQEIRCRKAPLSAILAALRREQAFPSLGLLQTPSLQKLPPPQVLSHLEQSLFSECFSGLGHSDSIAECRRLGYYRARFLQLAADAAAKEKQANALYPRLGLGAGAMLAITIL
jgi:hypothetical protein